jgi:putative oxidoreductase
MKVLTIIARVLLGLIFLVFGLNGFLHFLHLPPPTNPLAVQYYSALAITGYLAVVFALEIIAGLLLLSGFFVPLGLTILGPIIANTLLFHASMAPEGLPLPLLCTLLEVFLIWRYWGNFAGIVRPRA